ncbi:MAG: aldo/keto reductase [Actinobacteria bacterium]|nr:aldo/keto reductase [Actinomycetota bacterium]
MNERWRLMLSHLPAVPRVTLGRSGIVTTKLGLGTANWIARQPDDVFRGIIREALRLGIRHFDTAPSYDQPRFARLLAEADPPDDVVIVTKIGRLKRRDGPGVTINFAPDLARQTVDENLRTLGLERLPIVLLHDCRPEHMARILESGGTLDALRELQGQGLVGAIGVAAGNGEAVAQAAESNALDIIQSYHHYTLLSREATARIFPACRRHDLGMINLSPFAGNILATGATPGARYSYRDPAPDVLDNVRRMELVCANLGVPLPIAALTYSLACPDVDVSVIGPVTIDELRADVAALDITLSDAELATIASKVDHRNWWH